MSFKISYSQGFYFDLQQSIDFYNSRKKGLGTRFFKTVKSQIAKIQKNAYGFQIRYHNIRCSPLDKFPYMVHYWINQESNTIIIIALFSDFRNPNVWENRTEMS